MDWKYTPLYGVIYVALIAGWAVAVMFDKTFDGVIHFAFMLGMIFAIIFDIKRRSPGYSI